MIEVNKTTYLVEGCQEPCFEVSDGYTMVRIAKYYHYIGKNTLILSEYIDGEWNSSDEWDGDFDSLTESDAKALALRYSAYFN